MALDPPDDDDDDMARLLRAAGFIGFGGAAFRGTAFEFVGLLESSLSSSMPEVVVLVRCRGAGSSERSIKSSMMGASSILDVVTLLGGKAGLLDVSSFLVGLCLGFCCCRRREDGL